MLTRNGALLQGSSGGALCARRELLRRLVVQQCVLVVTVALEREATAGEQPRARNCVVPCAFASSVLQFRQGQAINSFICMHNSSTARGPYPACAGSLRCSPSQPPQSFCRPQEPAWCASRAQTQGLDRFSLFMAHKHPASVDRVSQILHSCVAGGEWCTCARISLQRGLVGCW